MNTIKQKQQQYVFFILVAVFSPIVVVVVVVLMLIFVFMKLLQGFVVVSAQRQPVADAHHTHTHINTFGPGQFLAYCS